jgi:hypothetical protein
MAQSLAPADADAPSACESAGSASSPVDEFTDPEAAPLDAAPAAGLVAPQPVAGGVAPTSAGSAVEVTAVTASGSGTTAAAATPGDGGGSLGQPALHAGASVHGAAAPPVHAAGAPEMPAFADLVARYRETWTEAAAGSDGAAAGGWGASPGQPLLDPAGQPAGTGSPSTSPPEAVRLAEFLLRQAPLAGSPGDPVQMIFPQGSGPIDQIVFMRDARGLFMVVSSQSGSREAVQRGLGELERRLRERGIAVGGIRLADPVASAQDRAEGGEG